MLQQQNRRFVVFMNFYLPWFALHLTLHRSIQVLLNLTPSLSRTIYHKHLYTLTKWLNSASKNQNNEQNTDVREQFELLQTKTTLEH